MNNKKNIKISGIVLLTVTLFFNLQYALLDYGMNSNSLGLQLIAQTNGTGGSSGGQGTGGGGTGGGGGTSTPLTCNQRGGAEMPNQVLQVKNCMVEISAGYPGGVKYVQGNKCKCKTPPSGYQGIKGCDLSWETACVKA